MNTSELKISVVVPVYNCEKYIERAIESVIKQTYDNWELIIVNDGSKDSSLQIAQKFAGKDKRMKVIDRENQGVSVARNIGIDEVSGDLLMFLDADDWFEEKAFEIIAECWDGTAQMILFDYWDVPENGEKQYRKRFQGERVVFGENGEKSIGDLEVVIANVYSWLGGMQTLVGVPWGKVFDASYIKKNKIEYPKGIINCEDVIFNLKAIDGMESVLYLSEPIYDYYMNMDSLSNVAFKKNGEKLINNFLTVNQYAEQILLNKNNKLYEEAYHGLVFYEIKAILYWLADETDKNKKIAGRKFCCSQKKEIRKHLYSKCSLSDRVLMILCLMGWFGMVEWIVRIHKKLKRVLKRR